MPDLQSPQSLDPIPPAAPTAPGAPSARGPVPGSGPGPVPPDVDPLTGLKKMSTTAGLGSGDYVAINPMAVIAVLVSVASVLALILNSNQLLLIPAAGVVCALIAFRQIRHSNGTQTGRGLAAAGLLLSLLIGGGFVVNRVITHHRFEPEQRQIADVIRELGQDVAEGGDAARAAARAAAANPSTNPTTGPASRPDSDAAAEAAAARYYDAAYSLFSDKFRRKVDEKTFKAIWADANRSADTGIRGMEWNGQIDFSTETGTGSPVAWAMAKMKVERVADAIRQPILFTKSSGTWKIDDMPQIFSPSRLGK